MGMEVKDLYFSDEEMQPRHSNMFDTISLKEAKSHVQDVATNAKDLCYRRS